MRNTTQKIILYASLAVLLVSFLIGGWAAPIVTCGFMLYLMYRLLMTMFPAGAGFAKNTRNTIRFIIDFIVDLTVSNFKLAWDVLTPTDYHKVRLIEVPIDDLTDMEIVFLTHRITLTPGTLSCAISKDGKMLMVHAMYLIGDDAAQSLRRPIDILKGVA